MHGPVSPRPSPRPTRAPGRRGLAGVLAGFIGLLAGCDRPPQPPVPLLTTPIAVEATILEAGARPTYRVEVRKGDKTFEIRTTIDGATRDVPAALKQLVVWSTPYLFVREDNGGGNAWRADVDHVFRLDGSRLIRLGTVAARDGAPGAQLQGGRFLDIYDRLEFTPFAPHAQAPGFTLVMVDGGFRFEVRLDETWERARSDFEAWRAGLRRWAEKPPGADAPGDRREAQAVALRCLTLTRYCRRTTEYDECATLAKRALGSLTDLEEALEPVTPGELAPSVEEVFRQHPGLINVFRETPAPTFEPVPAPPPESTGSRGP